MGICRSAIRALAVLVAVLACLPALPVLAQEPGAQPEFKSELRSEFEPERKLESKPESKPASTPGRKPERKLMPVDEGSADTSWVQFRGWLQAALQRGDRKALVSILDANILNPLEVSRGIAEFRKIWDLEGKDERLMRDLPFVLQLGSAWYQPKGGARLLCAPYVPLKWPLDDVDPYHSGAIVVKEALIKEGPTHGSPTLGSLSYDIVAVNDWEVADTQAQARQRWVKIQHAGRDGYVPEEHIRSAIEHRACFAKTGGGWRMMEYVLGIEYLGG